MTQMMGGGKLDRLRGRIQSMWGDVTDDDVDRAEGDMTRLAGIIKEKTGESIESIQSRLEEMLGGSEEEGRRHVA